MTISVKMMSSRSPSSMHNEGDIFTLEQSYIEICLERPVAVREACAEGYRVELTEEQKTAPPSE